MLEYLRIRGLALIDDMALEFGPGMNALTGETGAGKTFILKAINFLLGEKMGSDLVRSGAEKAQVEAVFIRRNGEELLLKRELTAETGRSRFFINGDLSSQEAARDLRPELILHAGQHGQQRLLQPSYQAALVDFFLEDPELGHRKDELLKSLKLVAEERGELLRRVKDLGERRELLEMQQKEIDKVAPEPGEEERLEAARRTLKSASGLRELYDKALTVMAGDGEPGLLGSLGSLDRVLEQVIAALRELSEENYSPAGEEAGEADANLGPLDGDIRQFTVALDNLRNFREEAHDLERAFRLPPPSPSASDDTDYDPEELEARLFALAQLKRKLKRSLPEILELQKEIEENLSFLDACGLDLKQLDRREHELAAALHEHLHRFNQAREKAAGRFREALEGELKGLGFSDQVKVLPEIREYEVWPMAGEIPACMEKRVRLLWAPNPGQSPQPLDRIASGGELSRFLLAVVGIQASREEATLIFDEVDAGVGGVTLNRVAERLEKLAARQQMLLITHWPQLAARAGNHFVVAKEFANGQTFTRCRKLEPKERDAELSRMAGRE